MATNQLVKRAQMGMVVKADVSGAGEWIVGKILDTTDKHINIAPADGTDTVSIVRGEVFKATQAEWDEFAGLAAANTDQLPEGLAHIETEESEEVDADDQDEDAPEDETEEEARVRIRAKLENYTVGGEDGRSVTISGRKTVDINDLVASHFRQLPLDDIYAQAALCLHNMGVESVGKGDRIMPATEEALRQRYSELNRGMQRMNLGNIVRNAMERLGLDKLPL